MHRKTKQIWAFVFLLFVTLTYLAINFWEYKSTDEGIKTIYFADRMTAAHRILIDEYNELHKGKIEIIPIDFPNDDFSTNERKELVARSLRGRGDGIDLFAVDPIWVQRFAKWAEPLDKYFTDKEKDDLLSKALASCYSDGQLVAIPLDLVQTILYYREDILKKVKNGDEIISKIRKGITWNDFIKLKSEIGLDNPFYFFPAADYEGLVCSFIQELLSLDPEYFLKEGFNFETWQAQKSLQLLVDLVNKYKISPYAVTQFTEIHSYERFINNDGIFLKGWPTYDKDFKDYSYDTLKQNNLRKAPTPHFADGRPTSLLGGWDLMISKFSDKKPEVIDFVKFLISEKSQEIFYLNSGFCPILKKFYDDSLYLKKYPEFVKYKELLKTAVSRPGNPEYTRYSKIMSFYFNEAIENKISVKNALIKSTRAIQSDKMILQ
ncbi:MAG: extracellular solute-binding protein [Ignavibacteriaceae bacterium]|jgi:multiple sugar transport system substrate-binding protein